MTAVGTTVGRVLAFMGLTHFLQTEPAQFPKNVALVDGALVQFAIGSTAWSLAPNRGWRRASHDPSEETAGFSPDPTHADPMRAPGLIGTLQLAAVLALAVPLLLFGVDSLLRGRTLLGGAFVALGALMLFLQWWLTNPLDPADLAEAAAERVTREREE